MVPASAIAGKRQLTLRVCSPQLGISPNANLGGAVYDRELLTALASIGVRVSILLPAHELVHPVNNWEIRRTPQHFRSYYEYNWIFFNAIRGEYRRERFDVLRVHSPYSIGPGALVAARRIGVPAVLHYLHVETSAGWRFVDRMTLRRYAHVVTISESTRSELMRRYGLASSDITVAHPGVAPEFTPGEVDCELRKRWGGDGVVLYVGGLIPRKNVSLAVESIDWLRQHNVSARLVIAGIGSDETALRQMAEARGLTRHVEFLGRVTEDEKLALFRSADVFFFPSRLEGFGMVLTEAMACGLPVVAIQGGPTAEIIQNQVNGLLVDPVDGAAGAGRAIKRVLESASLRSELADAGRQRAAAFSWKRSAEVVFGAYERTVRRAKH